MLLFHRENIMSNQHDSSDHNRRLFVFARNNQKRSFNNANFFIADRMSHRIVSNKFSSRN